MGFNPLIVVAALLTAAGLASIPGFGEALGVGPDITLQQAVVHAELAASALLLFPRHGGRGRAVLNLLATVACFAAASACVLLFQFAARGDLLLDTRVGALAAWMFAGGALALGARFGPGGVSRARIGLIVLYAMPVLFHYFALEYASRSLVFLRGWSPSWALSVNELSWKPLLPAAALPWALALGLPGRKEAE